MTLEIYLQHLSWDELYDYARHIGCKVYYSTKKEEIIAAIVKKNVSFADVTRFFMEQI